MKKADFQKLDEAFNRSVEMNTDEQQAFLAALADSDPEIAMRLGDMLRAAESDRDHLHESVQKAATQYSPKVPSHIGPFKVVRQLGAGGMGAVYLCTRSDDDFTQMLAVKRLSYAAAATAFGRDRLILERRVLARLRHPNIAQLVDGGDDEDGTPYVAMEYIEGTDIIKYADAASFNRRARLKLFLPLCAAIQFAHQNAIIHRDLKPDNVLVDTHEQIKLLDFGIAKLLDESEESNGLNMQTVAGAMTPHYASPEQVRGERLSQASDIYSLGMILYELLAGKRAYALETTRPSDIERIVCHGTPELPSRVAQWRGAAGRDLDAIVLKALHKEPDRRYASAREFGDDIERWLDGRPVLARPDSSLYRMSTFARRHPVGLTVTVIGLLMLTLFTISTSWQARQLAQQRDIAEHEARVANESADFLMQLFYASDPRERNLRELTAHDLLDEAARRLPETLPSDPLARASMMQRVGLAFSHLEDANQSIALLRQALAIRERETGEISDETAETLNRLGNVLRRFGQLNEAETMLRRALDWRAGQNKVDYNLGDSYNNLGLLQRDLGKFAEAEGNLRESIRLHEQANGTETAGLGAPLHNLSIVLREQGRLEEAREAAERSLEIKRIRQMRVEGVAHTQSLLAGIENRLGRLDDALRNGSESLELRRSIYGDHSPLITRGLASLAEIHLSRGEFELARELHLQALNIHRDTENENSLQAAHNYLVYGQFLLETGKTEEARKQLQLAHSTASHFLQTDSAAMQEYLAALSEAGLEPRS